MSIAGTVTYEDVTNVDSVGVITARSGINVGPTSGIGITLTSAGAITAAGKVRSGGNANTGAAAGALLSQEGNIQVARSNAPGTVFQGYTVGNSTPTTVINANGSATFASSALEISSTGNLSINRTSATNDILNGKLNGSVTSTINADGLVALGDASNSTGNNGLYLGGQNGSINIYTDRYNTDCFQILNTSGSGTNIAVKFEGNGSGTFQRQITSERYTETTSLSINIDGVDYAYASYDGGTLKSSIRTTGYAVFSGGEYNNELYVRGTDASTQRYLNFVRPTSGQYRATLRRDAWYLGETVTNIGDVTPSGANITLKMNGDATFAGTVATNLFSISNVSGNIGGTGGVGPNDIYIGNGSSNKYLRVITFGTGAGNVSIVGALSKGSGSFRIDHPLPAKTETHHLVHSFIEGPQADLIYRGVVDLVDGTATVNIDTAGRMTEGTFAALCTNVSCFTSNESDWTAVKGSVTGNVLTITAQDNTSTATVSWMVVGERKDQHMIDTNWTDDTGRVITEPVKS